ncbi:DUF397 domain-containing protein [Streptomyces laurentii]|uniref:DUF397 domain-containing protein n=1 Tax=Streptomyces laurentii TaxID=39478 RepID=UPI0036A2E9B2
MDQARLALPDLTTVTWRTSSYSGAQGECVEVAFPLAWRTSTYSGGNNECVQVAPNLPHLVPVRDSKRPAGPALAFSPDAWRAFVADLG